MSAIMTALEKCNYKRVAEGEGGGGRRCYVHSGHAGVISAQDGESGLKQTCKG